MSTKCTIKYSNGKPFDFHFYNEVADEENVYLQLNDADCVEKFDKYGITVRIPIEVWQVIREYNKIFRYAYMTDGDIEYKVIIDVDERIEKHKEDPENWIINLHASLCYGLPSEPREKQIEAGIKFWTHVRDREAEIVEKIKEIKEKN